MAETNLEDILSKGYEAMNQAQFNKALTFFNMAIKELEELSKEDSSYSEKLDEIQLVAKNCKVEIRKDLLEKAKIFIKYNKISLILEHYKLIIQLTNEIGDIDKLETYTEIYEKYKQIYLEKESEEITELMEKANVLKNKGKFERSLDIYRETLVKARMIENDELIESLESQLQLIPVIKRKERRKFTLENAKKAIEDEKFLLAISLYKLAAKYSAELGEEDKEKEFLDEAKRIEKLKNKFEKQRKKEDTKIAAILEKAEQNMEQGDYFEAVKSYQKVRNLRNSSATSDEQLRFLNYAIEQYFIDNFMKKNISKPIKDVIKIVEELAGENETFSLTTLYERALKRLLIPKEEISAIIYILHKINVLL